MNISMLCLSIILVAALFYQTSPAPWEYMGSGTTLCCFSYTSRKLPQSHVQEYFYTSSRFVTSKKQEVCANPDARWVKQ
uniref:Chemokine interleukin-8-like domain-containing protein n=1 Tax=Malurus cyaneus samueli TaxID=2593467 RepID=A0A8C5TKK4_9PASS